jgi:hypothetical protein
MKIHRLSRPLRGACAASLLAVLVLVLALAASAQASALPTLTLTVTSSSLTVGGSTASGAVNVISTAPGLKEVSTVLFLIKPGTTEAEVEAGVRESKKDPNLADRYGAIVFDSELPSSGTGEAQVVLQPGRYLALAGEGEHGAKQHTFFTVTAAASPAALPTPEATIKTIDFGFRGPTTLRDGERVRFENEGFLVHMDVAFRAKSRRGAEKIYKDLLTGHERGLEKLVAGEPVGFAGPVSHEAIQQETITAKPGWYVQACFMDTQSGLSHTLLGMERIFKIVK